MLNNDILRRLRYTFDFNDDKMIEIFGHARRKVTRAEVSDWLRKEEDEAFQELYDKDFSAFLNGFIIHKRGKREGVPLPPNEKSMNNNLIFRKLKIALNMRDEDVIETLDSVDIRVSVHEISAFFRKPTQSQYRVCHDQFLRNFLKGLQLKLRGE